MGRGEASERQYLNAGPTEWCAPEVARGTVFKWAMPKAVPTPKPEPKANAKAKAVPEGPIASRTRKKKAVSLD